MSSRGSSPTKSVEAFAETRRRGYTNENRQGAVDLQAVRDDLNRIRTYQSLAAEDAALSHRSSYIYNNNNNNNEYISTDRRYTLSPVRRESACECLEDKNAYELSSVAVLSDNGDEETGAVAAAETATVAAVDCDELEKFVETERVDSGRSSSSSSCERRPLASDDDYDSISKDPNSKVETDDDTRFSFFSSGSQNTIHSPTIGGLLSAGRSYRDLFRNDPNEGGAWWLDVLNPNAEELAAISKAFHVHHLTSEDIETHESREKVELFKHYYFISFQSFCHWQGQGQYHNHGQSQPQSSASSPSSNNNEAAQSNHTDDPVADLIKPSYEPVKVYMVVFRNGILTFTFSPDRSERHTHGHRVRNRIAKVRDFLSMSSDWLCYAMIDDIVDTFGPVISNIDTEAATIEDDVFIARPEDFATLLPRIGQLRKKVMGMLRLLGGKADVIKGFAKRCNDAYAVTPQDEIGLYLGDVQDHIVTMTANLSHLEKMLSRSHSNYLASLSMKNIIIGNHINESLTKITVLATILMPLNMISSLFGMNVKVPGQDKDGWFWGIAAFMFGVAAVAALVARRYKLL